MGRGAGLKATGMKPAARTSMRRDRGTPAWAVSAGAALHRVPSMGALGRSAPPRELLPFLDALAELIAQAAIRRASGEPGRQLEDTK